MNFEGKTKEDDKRILLYFKVLTTSYRFSFASLHTFCSFNFSAWQISLEQARVINAAPRVVPGQNPPAYAPHYGTHPPAYGKILFKHYKYSGYCCYKMFAPKL